MPATKQRSGDPAKGRQALLERGYIGCGVPLSLYMRFSGMLGRAPRIAGRTGKNRDLPFFLTAYTSKAGVEVVSPNCLSCHAAFLRGKLVVGLGDSSLDFTLDPSLPLMMAGRAKMSEAERAEWDKIAERVRAIAPYTRQQTVGTNPGDSIAAALFAHRDPKTLAWSKKPLMPPPPTFSPPVDVPPWWHMRFKNAMFYTAAGRGDHARIMMSASALCTDSVADARAIDEFFPDVRAYLRSIEPPPYPFSVNAELAAQGEKLFADNCSECHGSYGENRSYPNRVISLPVIGTDPVLADGAAQFAGPYIEWWKNSFYGEISRIEPERGYIAPPLDGIWATAPYFHNGSVPSVEGVLHSAKRPPLWRRIRRSYDQKRLGFAVEEGAEGDKWSYDTGALGHRNTGHLFGDELTPEERLAVIEYLKTL